MEIIILIGALALTLIGVKFFQNLYFKNNIIDKIIDRSSHKERAARSGGITIFSTIFFISLICYFLGIEIYDFKILIPLSILLFIGIYDDIQNIDFKLKFVFQIIAAKIMIDNGLVIDNMHGVLGIYELNRIVSQLITIFLIVAIINSINFIDGIDGLAVSVVGLFIILYEFLSIRETSYSFLSIIIIASFIPILIFNFKRKDKVFLGDSGSLFLGGLVSIYVMNILSANYLIKPEYDLNKILFVFSILVYPIIDMSRVIILRIMKKKSPFLADKNHIHHFLLDILNKHSLVVSTVVTISLVNFIVFHLIF